MAKPRGEDVRRQIILATFMCVARNGASGMTLREVARLTGMSTGTITYHFGSRRGLLLDAIDYGYWHLPPELFDMAPAEALRWVLHRYELSDDSRRTWWRFWLAITSHSQGDPDVAERLLLQHQSIVERWRGCLEQGMREGELRPDLNADAEAARLAAYAHGLAITQLIDPSSTRWAAAELSTAVDALRVSPTSARRARPAEQTETRTRRIHEMTSVSTDTPTTTTPNT